MTTGTQRFFATCPRGLETVLDQELAGLGAAQILRTDGGVEFSGPFDLCYRVNLESRVASRVLWRIAQTHYQSEEDVYRTVHALPWRDWFEPSQTIRVNVTAIKSPLKSLDFITLKIKDALCDKFRALCGRRPSVDTANPDVRVHGFFAGNSFALYLDTSGEALFKRGYRRQALEAPVRENLAAGILRLSGWQPEEALLDPMCGSGTFLLEAALIALNIAPGARRRFAFEQLKNFDARAWTAIKQASKARQQPTRKLAIYGSDIDPASVAATRANLAELGLDQAITVLHGDFLDIPAPANSGVLVTNPPYGMRLGEQEELEALYPRWGDTLKRNFAGWRAYFFTSDTRLPKVIRLSATRRMPLFNGAIECRLYEYKMVAGGMRKPPKDEGAAT